MKEGGGLRYLCRGQWLDSSWVSFLQEQTVGKFWVRGGGLAQTRLSEVLVSAQITGERTSIRISLTGWGCDIHYSTTLITTEIILSVSL
jgi:hypothetical protein